MSAIVASPFGGEALKSGIATAEYCRCAADDEIEDPNEYDLSIAYSLACALRKAPQDADVLIEIAKRGSRRPLDWSLVIASLRNEGGLR